MIILIPCIPEFCCLFRDWNPVSDWGVVFFAMAWKANFGVTFCRGLSFWWKVTQRLERRYAIGSRAELFGDIFIILDIIIYR